MNELVVNFDCHSDRLIGILHQPLGAQNKIGVVIVVGGPQYRVGSHRQFTIMARAFAAAGYPTLRFDYRGMGDSEGEFKGFEYIDDDIKSAIDALVRESPKIDGVVLWGLCDAASACLIYANQKDDRVKGMILANPWVRTVSGEAKAYLKHYYLQRFFQKSFWNKLLSGSLGIRQSTGSFFDNVKIYFSGHISLTHKNNKFIERMYSGFVLFDASVLFLISDQDLTAKEFTAFTNGDSHWNRLLTSNHIQRYFLHDADHTFSNDVQMNRVSKKCLSWMDEIGARLL